MLKSTFIVRYFDRVQYGICYVYDDKCENIMAGNVKL